MHAIGLFTGGGLFWESIVNWYRDSVFHELLTYFSDRYFSVDFHLYEHIPLGPSLNGSAEIIILAIMLGLIFASVVMAISKARYGRFVSKLLKEECFSPEKSKTLSELEEFRNSSVRRDLSRGTTLAKCVYCVRTPDDAAACEEPMSDSVSAQAAVSAESVEEASDAEEGGGDAPQKLPEMSQARRADALKGEERLDFTVARFYIPEDFKYRAEVRFERRGSGWIPVALTVILSVVGAALFCHFLPDFIQVLDNLISMMAPTK